MHLDALVRRGAAVFLAALLASTPALARISTAPATLTGAVVAAGTREPLRHARLHAGDPASGVVRSAPAGPDGTFVLRGLPPAVYDIAVESDSKLYTVSAPVGLAPGARRSVNVAVPVSANEGPEDAGEAARGNRMNWWNNPATATLFVLAGAVVVGIVVDAVIDDSSPTASPSAPP